MAAVRLVVGFPGPLFQRERSRCRVHTHLGLVSDTGLVETQVIIRLWGGGGGGGGGGGMGSRYLCGKRIVLEGTREENDPLKA